MNKGRWSKKLKSLKVSNLAKKHVIKVMSSDGLSEKNELLERRTRYFKHEFPILLQLDAGEENKIVRGYIKLLMLLLVIQTIAILVNVLSVWSPNNPEVWRTDWQTITSKCIITLTCVSITRLVYIIRKIDQKQIPVTSRRSDFLLCLEMFILMIHIPPVSMGIFSAQEDVWNIMGTGKLYLVAEILKVDHPIWQRRYEVNAARLEERSCSYLVGTIFCWGSTITKLDPMFIFVALLLLFLGMFTTWIYIMERSQSNFDLMIMVDHVLSSFFSVPPADHGALQTITGRNIKMLTGLFSMFYAAVVGWTIGFRVAENKQYVEDMLTDLNANLELQEKYAKIIQRWWREASRAKKNNEVMKKRKNIRPGVVWRVVQGTGGLTNLNVLDALTSARKELSELGITNGELKKSNERLKRSHQEMINLVLVLVSSKRY